MKKNLVLYDLDGTLVDTKEDIAASANHMLRQMGGSSLTVDEVVPYVGMGLRQLISSCLRTEDAGRVEEGMRIYRAHYARHMLDRSRLYPGARDILEHFKLRKQAVITNKPNPYSKDILAGLDIGGYFVEVVGGDSEHPKKPDPAAFLFLMEKTGVSPEETLFVGDSVIDIRAGRAAGVFTAILTHGFEREETIRGESPDLVATGFETLLEIAKDRKW